MVMYLPVVQSNTIRSEFILSIDYAPTLLDLAGINIGSHIQGKSFMPLLKGEKCSWRKSFMMEYFSYENPFPWLIGTDYKAIRNERYKYIHWVRYPDKNELYDLIEDPYELNNLFTNHQYKDIIKDMERELSLQVAKSVGLHFPRK